MLFKGDRYLEDKILSSVQLRMGNIIPVLGYFGYTRRCDEILNFSRWEDTKYRMINFNASERRRLFLGIYNWFLISACIYSYFN
ncbi:hypothetical protein J4216_04150 [Candidatus Woesearchaeota archaeon]|nr:hypothetical protein [Candidatus Woesearchaeota archaeon]